MHYKSCKYNLNVFICKVTNNDVGMHDDYYDKKLIHVNILYKYRYVDMRLAYVYMQDINIVKLHADRISKLVSDIDK